MRRLKILFLLLSTVLFFIPWLQAKPDYSKKEGKACAYCHTQGKELNDVGKCYEKSKKLDDCATPEPKPPKEKASPPQTKTRKPKWLN